MLKPAVSPGDPEFIKVMDQTSDLLQTLMETKGTALFFPGSGRMGIEAAITSIAEPGDRILTVNGGVFGKWLGITVERAGGENVELAVDFRRSIDPEAVRQKLSTEKGIKAVAVVHNETSTGVVNPVAEIGEVVKEYGAFIKSNFRGNYKEDCGYLLTTPPIDADAFLYDMYHSDGRKNAARLKDPHMDKLIEAQRREINEEKRLKILHEIQLYMAEEMFTAPVQASGLQNVIWGDVIKGYKMHLVPSYNIGDRFRITWRAK